MKLNLILWIPADFSITWTGNSFPCLNKDDLRFTKRLLVDTASLVVSRLGLFFQHGAEFDDPLLLHQK